MKNGHHILIVNYDFPPNEGIGGRRWAKFAKQLAAEGYDVHVIKADPIEGNNQSVWKHDVEHENIHVYSLPRKYPVHFSHPKRDVVSRIKYRLHKWRLERNEEGTIYDISIGWKNELLSKAQSLIREYNIVNVMASGAPWKMLYDISGLKSVFAHLNLIIDYRDPWLKALNYGIPGLNADRKRIEEMKQTFILENASVIVTPYEYLTEELRQWNLLHCKNHPDFRVLTHFYDKADTEASKVVQKEKITLIYGGDLYQGIEKELLLLKSEILEIKSTHPLLYQKLSVKIFTHKHNDKTFADIEAVEVLPSVGKEIFKEVSNASAVLIFLSPNKKNDRTTKFFENLPSRKPYLIVAEDGEVTQFVKENKLGYVLNKDDGSLAEFLQLIDEKKLNFNEQFNYEKFELKEITRQLISMFK